MPDNDEENIIPIDLKHTISVHDAVFQLLGITYGPIHDNLDDDYEPTLNEVLFNIQEDAVIELANAVYALKEYEIEHSGDAPEYAEEVVRLNAEIRKCEESLEEAHQTYRTGRDYYQQLRNEIAKETSGKDTVIVVDQEETRLAGCTQITKVSFAEWRDQIKRETGGQSDTKVAEPQKRPEIECWEDLTIKISIEYGIAVFLKRRKILERHLEQISLINPKTKELNERGKVLFQLSLGKRYPEGFQAMQGQRKTMTQLRNSLKTMTGLKVDPFKTFNKEKGWEPRFELIFDSD